MAATLTEPAVLAAAKDTLYPSLTDTPNQYAVTETQFATTSWGNWPIPKTIRTRLSPYNSIRLANGEPDLLGVGMPATDILDADTTTTPVSVIEAKGHNTDPTAANVTHGINQAHNHLSEVNLGYVATPAQSITDTARTLARNLNIGIIAVHNAHETTLIEPPRITGAGDVSTTINAIRFQATTHHLTEGSFPVNHPKNYLGYVLALAAPGDTDTLYTEHVIDGLRHGRHGAILLNLLNNQPDGDTLTHLGAEVVRFARTHHASLKGALEEFDDWTGRSTRFTQLAPRWAQVARAVATQYKPTQLIIEALEKLHQQGVEAASIADVAGQACQINQPLAVEIFFSQDRREDVLSPDGELNTSMLDDPTVYKSGIHFQFKFQLYHIGLLTTGGTDNKTEVLNDEWALEETVSL